MSALAEILVRATSIRELIMAEVESATEAELAARPGDRWSTRDVLLHLGTCELEATRILGYLLRGEVPPQQEMLPPDEWNAQQLARYQHLDGPAAVGFVRDSRGALAEMISRSQGPVESNEPASAPGPAQAAEPPSAHVLAHLRMTPEHELGHLYQIREALATARGDQVAAFRWGLAYARQQVLAMVALENQPPEAFDWRPPGGGWSVKEILLHLSSWDRVMAGQLAALADDQPLPPLPFGKGEIHQWNREQIAALGCIGLTETLVDLGAARQELEQQVLRLSPDQLAKAGFWRDYRRHDLHHAGQIWPRFREWRKA